MKRTITNKCPTCNGDGVLIGAFGSTTRKCKISKKERSCLINMFKAEKEWLSISDEIIFWFSELLEMLDIENEEIVFSEESESLISKLAILCKKMNTYKKAVESNKIPIFLEKTKADVILAELIFKIVSAPTQTHAIASMIIYIPVIDEKLKAI